LFWSTTAEPTLTNKQALKQASKPPSQAHWQKGPPACRSSRITCTPPLGLNPRTFLWDPRVPEWAIPLRNHQPGVVLPLLLFRSDHHRNCHQSRLVGFVSLVLCNRQASLLSFCASLCRPSVYQSCKSVSWGGRGPVQFGLVWSGLVWSELDQGWCSVVPD
jgi:hypothetical protein